MLKVLNTRPTAGSQSLGLLLRKSGFDSVDIPFVEIVPINPAGKKFVPVPESYDALFFSSRNGMVFFFDSMPTELRRTWLTKPIHLVGPKSAPYAEALNATIGFFPREEASLKGFLREYPFSGKDDLRWLHPCSFKTALNTQDFADKGIQIDNLPVYTPNCPPGAGKALRHVWADLKAMVFCSGSAVDNLYSAAPHLASELAKANSLPCISIGESTTRSLMNRGAASIHQAAQADNASLVATLVEVLKPNAPPLGSDPLFNPPSIPEKSS